MSVKPTPHLEFAPPPSPGMGRAWVVAGVAHLVLFLALGLATAWKTQPQTLQAEAELWSAVPKAAAPRLQEPSPTPDPGPKPEPDPNPAPTPKPEPEPQPEPDHMVRDAQIALEKKKQQEKIKEQEKAAELKRKALEKEKKEAQAKAEKEKAEKEKAEKEKAEKQKKLLAEQALEKKKAEAKALAEEKKRKQELEAKAKAKADAVRAEAMRQENLKRIQGMAGATGGPNATGTALKSSGPSASYAGRLIGRIKPNITYPGDVAGNARAEVEVRVAADGSITSRRIVQSSGNKAWDDAVLRAIDKTEILPKDTDGRVPPLIVLGFRPMD